MIVFCLLELAQIFGDMDNLMGNLPIPTWIQLGHSFYTNRHYFDGNNILVLGSKRRVVCSGII